MNALNDWVHADRDRLTWLDCDRYVWSVFAGSSERWFSDPGTMIGATAQAQKLLQSDVLSVDLWGPFSRHLVAGGDAVMICEVLGSAEPRRNVADNLDALLHQFGADVAVVLECPSPRKLLGEGAEADFDALDDVATAVLEVIRTVADRPVHGLQLTCDTKGGPDEDELDSWSSVLAAAQHYRWVTAIRLDGAVDLAHLVVNLPGDLVLLPEAEPETVPDDRRHGAGLPRSAWTEGSEAARIAEAAGHRRFRFGEIPVGAAPEIVLDRIRALH